MWWHLGGPHRPAGDSTEACEQGRSRTTVDSCRNSFVEVEETAGHDFRPDYGPMAASLSRAQRLQAACEAAPLPSQVPAFVPSQPSGSPEKCEAEEPVEMLPSQVKPLKLEDPEVPALTTGYGENGESVQDPSLGTVVHGDRVSWLRGGMEVTGSTAMLKTMSLGYFQVWESNVVDMVYFLTVNSILGIPVPVSPIKSLRVASNQYDRYEVQYPTHQPKDPKDFWGDYAEDLAPGRNHDFWKPGDW